MLRELIDLSNNSNATRKFGYLEENASDSQKVSSHLSACTCAGCQSLVINRERLAPAPTVASAISAASLPLLSSNPGATAKLLLDFNGHTTSGTDWNTLFNGGAAFTTPAYSTDADTSTFSTTEINNITEIWKRVAEDYAPFNIDVTTVDSGNLSAPNNMRVVVGGSYQDWFEESGGAGGVAFINSWPYNDGTPAFVFEENLANGQPKATAEAISHEAGHTLGLDHQSAYSGSTKTDEYNPGGSGWAPIMGVSYYENLTTWHNGQSAAGATVYQDDMAIIASASNGFGGYRADDYGNTNATAKALSVSGTSVSGSGLISQNNDVDVFSFTTDAGSISLNVNVAAVGANLDAVAELYSSSGSLVASNNPTTSQSASLTTTVASGQYFLHVKSNGVYGRVGQYSISGSIISPPSFQPSPTTLAFTSATYSGDEGNSGSAARVIATIERTGSSVGSVSVPIKLASTSGTAIAGSDYTNQFPLTVVFNDGETTKTVSIPIIGDTIAENNETINLQLGTPTGGAALGSQATATYTILNDDAAPTFAIAATNAVQTEGNSGNKAYTFTVTRGGATGIANNVNWAVAGSGANPANISDFGGYLPTGILSFSAGQTSKQITVNVRGDINLETNEDFTVTLSNPTAGASIITPTAIGTIQNDDAPPTLAIAATNAHQTEGNTGNKGFTFTVARTGDTTVISSANWAVAGSGANPADLSDFSSTSGTVNFLAGQTSQTITINVKGDAIAELDENFTVSLSGAMGTTVIATAAATGKIRNDDLIVGTAGNDTLSGMSGNDTISGLDGLDVLSGLLGNDSIDGGYGNDLLTGGAGNDTLIGNIGNDTLIGVESTTGGVGEIDRLTGSTGNDRFVLGDATQTYYLGNGMSDYALITDFGTGDVLQKYGNDTLTIGGALPTGISGRAIYLGSDLVAVVQGAVPTLASFVSAV
jgi:Calx-beta domain/RTX calcium-binding nonapeptide repeat (4 copies)/Metallo-peptidase family M12B Reprolysin-like